MYILYEFKDMWPGWLGKISVTKHHIEMKPGARPTYQALYRTGMNARKKEKTAIDRMLRLGVTEPATAEVASPVAFIPNKDGILRFCVDYRKINTVTVRILYLFPRMND